jgi:phosphoenolpyruvate---glycerone phosphotransferase subunit DhaK
LARGTLKKLINEPADVVDELLEAFAAAHSDVVSLAAPRVAVRATPAAAKVGVTIGGGSGHEPAMIGYVGPGFADSAAAGNIFAAPGPEIVLEAIRAADHGHGVVLLYGNYTGDVLNCRLAIQRAGAEGIDVRAVYVCDDVASAPPEEADKRRGIAGDIIVFKAAGAAAESGMPLDEVERIARHANAGTRSIGVALSGAELPGATSPTFVCGPDEMEVGLGVHGEPGASRQPLGTAHEVGALLAERILDDLACPEGASVAVLVNGLGATPPLELYLVYRGARRVLAERGLTIARTYVGEFITSLQMAGLSLTVTRLDDELLALLDAPAKAVAFVR